MILLYTSPTTYGKAAHDEWDEVWETVSYYLDGDSNQFVKERVYGRDNARNRAANYEKTEKIVIMEGDLPAAALHAWHQLKKRP